MERWLEDVVRPYRAPSTYRTHRNYAGNHVYPALGMVKVKALTIHKLQTFFNEKKAAGVHPNTFLRLKHLVSGALTQGVKWGLLERNVARSVEVAKVPKFRGTTLSWTGGKNLLDVCGEDPVHGPLMFLAMLTAMRQGELLGLTWDKVDFAAETIRVEQTLQRVDRRWHIGDVKTESSKATISVDSRTTEVLTQHRAWQASVPMTEWTQLGLVFTDKKGMPLHAAVVGRKLRGFRSRRPCATATQASQLALMGTRWKIVSIRRHVDCQTDRSQRTHHNGRPRWHSVGIRAHKLQPNVA